MDSAADRVDGLQDERYGVRVGGLVGPDGAGGTTTLSMVTRTAPDGGAVEIAGGDVWRDPAAAKLPCQETLTYPVPAAEAEQRGDGLLGVLALSPAQTGMRKKIGLVAALLRNPRVLVLDEPFEGVDPVSAQTIRGDWSGRGGRRCSPAMWGS